METNTMTPLEARPTKAKVGMTENVTYAVRHCDVCAVNPESCPQRGTFHGVEKKLFQPYEWANRLIKVGVLSPHHVKLPFVLGQWAPQMRQANLITNVGRRAVAQLLRDGTGSPFSHIAVGTGTSAANATDTALEGETSAAGLGRASATTSEQTTDTTGDTARFLKLFSVTGTLAVTESGVFNNPSAGTPLCRQVFSAINVVNGDTLQITWDIDVD